VMEETLVRRKEGEGGGHNAKSTWYPPQKIQFAYFFNKTNKGGADWRGGWGRGSRDRKHTIGKETKGAPKVKGIPRKKKAQRRRRSVAKKWAGPP